ncbi:MFS general substrate transporter [Backusella circina FSU 941]|nr:MFS general substrate transporter [Backusella circina FSU 941]
MTIHKEHTPLLLQDPALTMKPKKDASAWMIIAPLFFITFGFGALYAPMVEFYTVVFCNRYYDAQNTDLTLEIPMEKCTIPQVQAVVSQFQAIIMFLTYGTTLVVASFYGALSDRKGRRLIFKIAAVGNMILMVAYIVTIKYQSVFGISLLFIAPVIRGFMAGDTVFFAATQAYISDCTTPTKRTLVFSQMMSATFLGASLGPSAASFLIKGSGSIISIFYIFLLLNLCFFLYVAFVLPESNELKTITERGGDTKTLLQRLNIFAALHILYRTRPTYTKRWTPIIAILVQFFSSVVALPPVLLYAMLKFGWTSFEGGFYVSIVSFSKLGITLFLVPFLSKLYHKHKTTTPESEDGDDTSMKEDEARQSIRFDTWMIRAGVIAETGCFILSGLAQTSFQFTGAGVIHAFAVLAHPSLKSLLIAMVKPSEVGELLGAVAVIEAFSMVVSQLTINSLYSATVGILPQLIFFFCSAVAGIALILSFFIKLLPKEASFTV